MATGAQRKNKRAIPSNRRSSKKQAPVQKTKKGLWLGVGAAALGALLLWNGMLFPAKESAAAAMIPTQIAAPKTPLVFAHTDQISGTIASGETLGTSLRGRGLSTKEIDTISDALRQNFDFRFTRTGDTYRILRDQKTNQIASFLYQRSPVEVYALALGEDQQLHASSGEIISGETTQLTIKLDGSLRKALEERKDGENLAQLLSSALSWQIDLHHATGGQLSLVLEKSSDPSQPYQRLLAVKYQQNKKQTFAFWYTDPEGRSAYVDEQGRATKQKFLRSPLQLVPVEQVAVSTDLHQYWSTAGTPVVAVADGEIVELQTKDGVSSLVVAHNNGARSFYENIAQLAPGIKRGILVNQQRFLGTIGTNPSEPAMLAFHVEQDGVVVELDAINTKGAMLVKDQERFKELTSKMMASLNQ